MCARLPPAASLWIACLTACGGGHGEFDSGQPRAHLEHAADPAPPREPAFELSPKPQPAPGDAAHEPGPVRVPDDEGTDAALRGNVSFETARALSVDDTTGLLQQVLSDAQVDYYSFEARAGTYYVITTNRGPFTPNTVITLHGPDLEPLAQNDYGSLFGGDGIDARLVVRLQQDGTHYLVIEDRTTPAEYFETDAPVLFYRLIIETLPASRQGFALADDDDDAPVEVPFAEHAQSGFRFATLVGTLSPGMRHRFDFQGYDAQALIGHASASGNTGNGSTSSGGGLEIADADATIVARIDRAVGQLDIHPPVSAQPYQLSVRTAGDASGGDNDFYAIDLVQLPENPLELDDEANDTPEGAEALEMVGGFQRRGLLLSHLPPGDVDHYRIEAEQDERMLVSCEGHSAGSGLRGLSAELSDGQGTALGFARENTTRGLLLRDVRAPVSGSYVVRLSAESLDDRVAGDWARCVVVVEP